MVQVSAIITTYNVETYVAVAVQSVLDAGLDDLEIILVDDGSTDLTRALITAQADALGARANIRPVLMSQNTVGGVATAANLGMDLAQGEIVVFVDGDDWVIPCNLKEAVDRLQASSHDFLVTDCSEYWNDSGRYTKYPEAEHWGALAAANTLEARRAALLKMAPFPWRKIYRRDFLNGQHIRFPVGDYMFEDNPFHWETSVKARSFSYLRKVTHVHRMARAGQTVGERGVKYLRIFEHYDTIRAMLERTGQLGPSEAQLAQWLIKHVVWAAERVPPGFLNEVFEKARQRLRPLRPELFWHAISVSGFNARDVRRLAAVYLDARFEFLREF